jgi:hypothetical protein
VARVLGISRGLVAADLVAVGMVAVGDGHRRPLARPAGT